MTRLKVQIDKERDLPALQAVLDRMGLKFWITEDDDLDDATKENAGTKTATEEKEV